MSGEGNTNLAALENQGRPNLPIHAGPCDNGQNAGSMQLRTTIEVKFIASRQYNRSSECPVPDWLTELREMRGRVCFDQGQRPFFRLSNGKYDDSDFADFKAYHIIVRLEGRAVGCARIMPLANGEPSATSSTLGEHRFEEILAQIGTTRARSCEASRWLVLPECRKGLGPQIVAASWAVARWLSFEVAFVLAGTRQKQDGLLIRLGAHAIDGVPLFPSCLFEDDLRLLYFDVGHPSQWMEMQIAEMTSVLKLDCSRSPDAITHQLVT